MTRNLKGLGLALIAVFAMGALVAAAAQADEFTAESYPVTIKGEQVSAEQHVFTLEGGRTVKCNTATFMSSGTLAAARTELTIDPSYTNCHAVILGAETDATVTFRETVSPFAGCDYAFTTAKAAAGSRIVHLSCEGTHDVVIHVYSELNGIHDGGHELCSYTVKAQTIENGVTYENMAASGGTKKDVTVKINSGGITAEKTVGTKVKCGEATQSATYVGNTTVQGENPSTHAEVGIDVG